MAPVRTEVTETDVAGPAGSNMFRISTKQGGRELEMYQSCPNCFMCGSNGLLAFRPRVLPDTNFYAYYMPASRPVTVQAQNEMSPRFHLLPSLFNGMIVAIGHSRNNSPKDGFRLDVPHTWLGQVTSLLPLVPDLSPGDPFSLHLQYGIEAGARPQGWEKNDDAEDWQPHGFMRVTYGRERLQESSTEISPDELSMLAARSPIATHNLGLDSILHQSRRQVGSALSDQQLWDIWERYAGEPDAIEQYHRGVLALTA